MKHPLSLAVASLIVVLSLIGLSVAPATAKAAAPVHVSAAAAHTKQAAPVANFTATRAPAMKGSG